MLAYIPSIANGIPITVIITVYPFDLIFSCIGSNTLRICSTLVNNTMEKCRWVALQVLPGFVIYFVVSLSKEYVSDA